jgi:hypothetical protein
MSKIKNLTCTICHWKDNKKQLSLETSFLNWRESHSTGTSDEHDITTWHWKNFTFIVGKVGLHPRDNNNE